MGAEFLEVTVEEEGEGGGGYAKEMSPAFIAAEMALFAAQAREVDIIITTALIPNRPAPVLITEDMVESMKQGSVIVDLAAEQGGNCALTEPGEVVERHGVHDHRLHRPAEPPGADRQPALRQQPRAPARATWAAPRSFHIDLERRGRARRARRARRRRSSGRRRARDAAAGAGAGAGRAAARTPAASQGRRDAMRRAGVARSLAAAGAALIRLGLVAPPAFLSHLTVFVLACFVGWQVVWNVTPALHTPLMSVTNAISGIIVDRRHAAAERSGRRSPAVVLGAVAILLAAINIAGGFLVTQRMLRMFQTLVDHAMPADPRHRRVPRRRACSSSSALAGCRRRKRRGRGNLLRHRRHGDRRRRDRARAGQ